MSWPANYYPMTGSRLLTSAEVALILGVTATTVNRWADSGLLACEKTIGNHRRFSAAQVDRFKAAQSPHPSATERSGHAWIDDLLRLLRDAPTPSAIDARLFEMHSRTGRWSAVADALTEALREMGERWVRGELSILDEHLMSERLIRALARLADWLPRNPSAPSALLAVPDGDEHTIGLALTELCFREQGWGTLWFGRRTPLSELPDEIVRQSATLGAVAISASIVSSDADRLARELHLLEEACQKNQVALILGGRGAWPAEPTYATQIGSFAGLSDILTLRAKPRTQGGSQ